MKKYVLVTGASSGLGKEIALVLAENGFKVFAGIRKEEDKKSLEEINSNIIGLFIDVENQESVDKAFETVKSHTDKLYALINNAGIALGGPIECLPVDAIKKQFEVNVYGAIRTAQKFLPILEGRIINISSMSSFGLFPFISPYCASKRALDIFFNSLLLESKNPNLKVISIKPGVVKTKIWDKSVDACEKIMDGVSVGQKEKYKKEFEYLVKNAKENNDTGIEPIEVANTVLKALTVKSPKLSYCVGRDAKMVHLYSKLPQSWINFLTKEIMKKRFK